jgi:glycosyltransferase involved in cell wall biosynthesis
MTAFITISIIFGVFYFIMISSFIFGIFFPKKNLPYNHNQFSEKSVFISVIIPFKNEEKNLVDLISGLKTQSLSSDLFEVIFVNDFSDDSSAKILANLILGIENFKIINSKYRTGKKNAVGEGIENSKGNLIVTTDADCEHGKMWLEKIYNFYIDFKPKMIIGPVKLTGETLFEKFQSLEYMSLSASTEGAANIKQAFMCSAANLAFEKVIYNECNNLYKEKYESGDDVFLLHKIKKKYRNDILFLNSKDAIVYTKAEKKLKGFINQRKRWASKAKGYKDSDAVIISLIVAIFNINIILFAILTAIHTSFLFTFTIVFLLKIIPDFIILNKKSKFYNSGKLMKLFLPFSIIYPFYISSISILSIFSNKLNWKSKKNK